MTCNDQISAAEMDIALQTKIKSYIETGRQERLHCDRVAALAAFKAAAELDPLNVLVKIELVKELRELNYLDEAEALLNTVPELDAHDVRILSERAYLMRRRGDRERAALAFKAASTAHPHNSNIQVELARELRALNRSSEADAVLNSVLASDPNQTGAMVERGHLRRQQGDREGAAAAFKAAAIAHPHNQNIQVELARDLRALIRLEEADAVLSSVLNAEPRHIGALIERGHLLLQRGDNAKALSVFEAAATIDPNHTALQLEIANVLRSLGQLRKSETVLRKLTKISANNVPVILNLSHFLFDANRLDEAEIMLNRALEKNPHDPRIKRTFGDLARRRGDYSKALDHFTSASALDPANFGLRLSLAAELREQGDLDGAKRLIQSVLEANTDHWSAWIQLGHLHRARREPRAAMNAFRTAAAKQPLRSQGLVELAHETWMGGNPKEAEQLLRRALNTEPSHLGAILLSAELELRVERPDKALQIAQRAIHFHAGTLNPYLLAARAASHASEQKQAINILQQARRIFGSRPELTAMHIYILRHFRDLNAVRSLIDNSREQIATNFSFWLESTSYAITVGDFAAADQALKSIPAKSKRELARAYALQAQIAEGNGQHAQAVALYQEALALDPDNGAWHREIARICLLHVEIDVARTHLQEEIRLDRAKRILTGRSLNISQHHIGQLIDEFVLDPEVLARLKNAISLPNERQIEPLKKLVRDNPDHTAPALLLLQAMRKAGAFPTNHIGPARDTPPKIPRRIVQYWPSEVPPDDISELMKSWSGAHGDYTHVVFNDATANNFMSTHYPNEVGRAFSRGQRPSQRANIFRLAYLALKGGYFVGARDRCLARLDALAPAHASFVGYQESYNAIGPNFLGATSDHPVITLALKKAADAISRGDRDIDWLSTGSGLLTRAFAQTSSNSAAEWLDTVFLLELWQIQRAVGLNCPVREIVRFD